MKFKVIQRMTKGLTVPASALAALVLPSSAARACATCFGDAQAPETRAAASAVIVLAAVVYAVLLAFGSVTFLWLVRSRRRPAGPSPATDT